MSNDYGDENGHVQGSLEDVQAEAQRRYPPKRYVIIIDDIPACLKDDEAANHAD